MERTLWKVLAWSQDSSEEQPMDRVRTTKRENADVESSLLTNGNHMVVLDIDLPCELRPSKRPGHFHLLIEKEMSWIDYMDLLEALARAGIIEEGYFNASLQREQTFIRLPEKMDEGR